MGGTYYEEATKVTRPYKAQGRRESALERRAVKWARARGIVVAKMTEVVGIPDRVFFTPRTGGGPVIPEFKRQDLKPKERGPQEYYLKALAEAGYHVGYCDTWEGFLEAMRKAGVE